MNTYLFLFSIGPVQAFISQARKTQDLFAGSSLLSDLIREMLAAAETMIREERFSGQFQRKFPAAELPSNPNRFLATVALRSDDRMNCFGNALKTKTKERFCDLAKKKFEEVFVGEKPRIPENFVRQINRHFDIYWAAQRLETNQYDAQKYQEFESLFGAIKNTRTFEPLDELGRKCSVCGERNVLFCRQADAHNKQDNPKDKMQLKPDWNVLKDEEKKIVRRYNENILEIPFHRAISMPDNEGLCAVCFTKRFYKNEEKFLSTSEIALCHQISLTDLHRFENSGDVLRSNKLDTELLYEENLTQHFLDKYHITQSLEFIRDLRQDLLKKNGLQGNDLAKYYALLKFDVDRMGKWLSGEHLQDEQIEAFHSALSMALGKFAANAKKDVDDSDAAHPKGRTVFAGGDDFLGFVNLKHLFDVLRALRHRFHEEVSEPLVKKFALRESLTFSAGVCIAHYKMPLAEVIKWAKAMEKEAKRDKKEGGGGRNAFAIAAMTHSGNITQTCFHWGPIEFNEQSSARKKYLNEILSNIVMLLQEDKFSRKFIIAFDKEFRPLLSNNTTLNIPHVADAIVQTEISRLVRRAKTPGIATDDDITLMKNSLFALYHHSRTFTNFLSALHIADFIKREAKPCKTPRT